jgi:hypothetical protein
MADSGLNTDEALAIGTLCITFGIGLMCLSTIFCRSFCVNPEEEPPRIRYSRNKYYSSEPPTPVNKFIISR